MAKFWCCLALLVVSLAGCASTGSPEDGGRPGICPSHPEQCGGKCCGNICVDINLDPRNCGDCGGACLNGQICAGGHCGCPPNNAPCGIGQSCCGGNGCKSLESDANNCGECGRTCGPGGICTSGQCTCGSMTCGANQICCNGTCTSTCVTDMGTLDLAMQGTCQCGGGCLFTCMGPDCCDVDYVLGFCEASTTCTPG